MILLASTTAGTIATVVIIVLIALLVGYIVFDGDWDWFD